MIQDTIRDRNAGILRVQSITDDVNVGLLLYLDRREQAKLYTVTRNEEKKLINIKKSQRPYMIFVVSESRLLTCFFISSLNSAMLLIALASKSFFLKEREHVGGQS